MAAREMWAWMVFDDGEWNIVAGMLLGFESMGMMPLVSSRKTLIMGLQPYADAHALRTGNEVKLVHFAEVE
jgi:hypothetical protein